MKTTLCAVWGGLTLTALAQTNVVVDGGFEASGGFTPGWSWVGGGAWACVSSSAAEGQNYVMVSGNLYQDLSTVPGQVYCLRYALAGDPYRQGPTTLLTFWAGSQVAANPFDTTGHSNENLGWIYITNYVRAASSQTRLWFGNAAQGTPCLDNVSAIAVETLPTTCVCPPADLVSWWPGRSNALDIVGTNHGSLLNGAGFLNGLVGAGFYLAGSQQCVQIPHASSLAASNYTVEAWVEPLAQPTDPASPTVLFAQPQGHCQLLAYPGSSGLRPACQFTSAAGTLHQVLSTDEIPLGQFTHLAGTWDGTALRLFINGRLNAEHTPGEAPVDSGCPFYLGGFSTASAGACQATGQFFTGILDEVSYYRRALREDEIYSLYSAGTLGKCRVPAPPSLVAQPVGKTVYASETVTFSVTAAGDTPLGYQWQCNGTPLSQQTGSSMTISNVQLAQAGNYSVVINNAAGTATSSNALLTVLPPPACVAITEGLISWWRAENDLVDGWGANNGRFAYNSSGSGSVIATAGYSAGKVGQAFTFGTNCMLVSDAPALRLTNGLTIEGWIYPQSLSGSTPRTILAKVDPPTWLTRTNCSYYFGVTNGQLYLTLSATGSGRTNALISASNAVPLQRWSYVAATCDGASMRLYLNGALIAATNYSGGIFPGTADLGLGGIAYYPGSTYWPWSGYLDEISLYNRALSEQELLAIYQADLTGKCLGPPRIVADPQSQVIPLGEDALFSTAALGSKPLRYQWYLNGQTVAGATRSSLVLEKVQSNQVGSYSVLVSNTCGSLLSASAQLELQPPPGSTPPPPGLLAWWPGEDSGMDVIGTNHASAAPGGVAVYAVGKTGRAFNFFQTNADMFWLSPTLRVPNGPALNFGSEANLTIEAWIKATPWFISSNPLLPQEGTNQVILDKRATTFPAGLLGPGYALSVYRGRLACWLSAVSGRVTNSAFLVSPGPQLRDSRFHHVALSLNRHSSSSSGLYVDGQLVLPFDGSFFAGTLSNAAPLMLGSSALGYYAQDPFNGLVDELAFYNRALPPNELLALYQAGAAGKCSPPPHLFVQPGPPVPAGWRCQLGLTGIPGRTYTLQWAETLGGSWTTLATLITDSTGTSSYLDTNMPPSGAFYRTLHH